MQLSLCHKIKCLILMSDSLNLWCFKLYLFRKLLIVCKGIMIFNFNNLFSLNFTIFLNFNMISDGNILRLRYFLFFIISSWSSIPSIILWLILKIKINEFFGCFLQLAKLQRQNYFLEPCIKFFNHQMAKYL